MAAKVTPVLTIAGSDSSGGAGIQADLKTFAAHGCYGASALTAMTAQNTTGVQAVHGSPPDFVVQQIRSVLDDIDVRAIKTGMLFDAANTNAVATTLAAHFATHGRVPLVCDPVCVSTSGDVLLDPDALQTLVKSLFPLSSIVTPNQAEAALLLKAYALPYTIASLDDMLVAARDLLTLGPEAVLLKGGHVRVSEDDLGRARSAGTKLEVRPAFLLGENMEILHKNYKITGATELVVDVLCQRGVETLMLFPRPRLQSTNTHGTGCTLSAALACAFANGLSVEEAAAQATAFTHLGIETAPHLGKGHGPLNHLHSVSRLVVRPRTHEHPYPLTHKFIESTAELWKSYVQHAFVIQLGSGTLERSRFIHFIKQDYLYLKYYSRAYALLATKSHDFTPISAALKVMLHIAAETNMHVSYCAHFGVSIEELEATPESPATTAYGAFLLDVGLQGDTAMLLMALAACLLGYGEVGLWLEKEAVEPTGWVQWQGNPYLQWMQDYAGEAFQSAVSVGLETIEERAAEDPPSAARYAAWLGVWERCIRLEKQFWDMAMNLS